MLDKETLVWDIMDHTGDDELFEGSIVTAVDLSTTAIIGLLRRKAGEYEDNRLFTAASALKQFANELEQS